MSWMVDERAGKTSGLTAQPNAKAVVTAIETTVTAEDLRTAWSYIPLVRAGRQAYLFMTLVGIAFLLLVLFRYNEAALAGILGIVLGNLAVLWLGVSVRRGWMRSTVNQLSGAARFRFDQAGFEWETPIRLLRLAWSAVPRYVETSQAFLIYTEGQGFALLPKRACEVGEIDAVREILATRVVRRPRRGIAKPLLVWSLVFVSFLVVWQAIDRVSNPPGDDGAPSSPAETYEPTR
jgi:hypothetical protein